MWRSLTSMGTALVLLFLLALAAIPGALLPQRGLNAAKVDDYLAAHPLIGPWLDELQAFGVFSSFWFTAIYVLLFVSLVGCLAPRTIEHARSLRATPVAAPRNLARLPKHAHARLAGEPAALAATITGRLRGWRSITRQQGDSVEVSAEKGYLREFGNLVFHFALLGLLVAVAVGKLFGYEGNVIVIADGGPGFVRRRRPRSTRFAPATPSTARRCTRSVCGSTTSKRTTCRPGRPPRSPPTSTIRPTRPLLT